jgi:glycosyltransferase involved in cell wall biosynthesis
MITPKETMRICLPTGIFPPDVGGPASYVPRIASAFSSRGYAVHVVTLADDIEATIPVYPFQLTSIPRTMPRLKRMLAAIASIRQEARLADGIYANGLFIEAAIAALMTRKPLVMKIVGDWAWERARNCGQGSDRIEDFQRKIQPIGWEVTKLLRSLVTRCAQRIIVPSHYLAGIVSDWGISPKRITVVHNALDPKPIPGAFELPAFGGKTIVTVARLVRWKGVGALIEWVAANKKIRLIVVGDGPEFSTLKAQATALGAGERVIFTGLVAAQDVAGWMRAADLFVLNSTYEGLPHIILEAFAAEVPVLATDAGGTPEIVRDGENGILIPADNRQALGEAMARVLEDDGLQRKLVAGGRMTLAKSFHWDALVAMTEKTLADTFRRQA